MATRPLVTDDETNLIRVGGQLFRLEPVHVGPGLAKVQPAMTYAEAAEKYLTVSAARFRVSTVSSTRMLLEQHILPTLGGMNLDAIDRGTLASLQDSMRTRKLRGSGPVKNNTVNLRMAKTMAVLRFARDELEAIRGVPKLRPLPSQRLRREHVRQHYEALLRNVKPAWLHLVVMLGGDAGLRVGEMLALRWACVREKALCICATVWKGHRGPTKGGRTRVVPIGPRLVETLKEQTRSGPTVLPGHLYSELVLARLLKACRRARVPHLTTHSLRHSYASELQARGVDVTTIRDLLGHSSVAITDRYLHSSETHLADAVARLGR